MTNPNKSPLILALNKDHITGIIWGVVVIILTIIIAVTITYNFAGNSSTRQEVACVSHGGDWIKHNCTHSAK